MTAFARKSLALLLAAAAVATAAAAIVTGGYYYVEPGLPHAEELRDVKLQVPLRVYSRDGRLIQQFGSQKRTPVAYGQIPEVLIQALIAAEDDQFFVHPGFDILATAKAGFNYLLSGDDRVPGGSTITQQVAREYFLSRDYSPVRKFKELILAFRIEREFSKTEILELFFNTFFFGQQSYGVAAAAQTYFGKNLDELTLSDAAILAGIPQGPSIMNPIYSPANAASRRAYVLRRMRELGFIDEQQHSEALAVAITGERHGLRMELDAPYAAEMARAELVRRFGQAAYTAGLKVRTTVDSRLQAAAQGAVRKGVIAYDERHGYRGPAGRLEPPEGVSLEAFASAFEDRELSEALGDLPPLVGLEAAVVLEAGEAEGLVYLASAGRQRIGLEAVQWARPYLSDDAVGPRPEAVSDVLKPGDIVRFRKGDGGALELAQLPEVQAAFVALDPLDGAVAALSGGFDFFLDSYNRATQSRRQPGSAFKPFVYSAALEHGFTVATIVNDAPLTIDDPGLETVWKPENYSNRFYGPVRLREALKRSLNAATVRVILEAGVLSTVRHLQQFGFDETALPRNASLALGAGGISPLDLAAGYAVFANGGFRVTPYFIDRIEDASGDVLYTAMPAFACADCEAEPDAPREERPALVEDVVELYRPMRLAPRAVTPQNAYLVSDMMRDVVEPGGTGAAAARELGRGDIAGKTGTTNERRDAWFAGFGGDIVGVAWVGFNQSRTLGRQEQGAVTAIPIWTAFMQEALDGVPERALREPPGIVSVRINPRTGLVARGAGSETMFEKFRIGQVPEREPISPYRADSLPDEPERPPIEPTDKIF